MKSIRRIIVTAVFLLFSFTMAADAADHGDFSTKPTTNNGKPWRIGYFEGGAYVDYQKILIETIKGLMVTGWVEPKDIPHQEGEQTEQLWRWLSTELRSDYIEFVKDGHYTAAWDEDVRQEKAAAVIERLNKKHDLDLMIAMGTWAGKELANNLHNTSTMVLSTSDPLSAGIIKSVEDSGYRHVHATVDPNRYERQVRVFHDLVGFKYLGVAYENSKNGRSYAALDVIEKLSRERKFEIVRCFTKSDISDISLAEESVVQCFKELSEKADAIYVTNQGGITSKSIPVLVGIVNDQGIPTFSQSGSEEVKKGFLLSLSQAGFRYVGEFHASTFAKVFNGAEPNQLSQLFEEPPRMALNLKTAEIVGFNPPLLLLGAADEIYRDIPSAK